MYCKICNFCEERESDIFVKHTVRIYSFVSPAAASFPHVKTDKIIVEIFSLHCVISNSTKIKTYTKVIAVKLSCSNVQYLVVKYF